MPTAPLKPDDAAKIEQIIAQLKIHEARSVTGAMGRLLMGLGICLGVGVVISFFVVFILVCLYGTSWLGLSGWLGVYLVVLVPLLIWQERRSRSDPLTDLARSIDAPTSMSEARMNLIQTFAGTAAAMIVWGPQAIIDGYRGLLGSHSTLQKAAFDRAGLLVLDLSKVMGGVEIKRLVHPPEDMGVFGSAVDLLDRHSWIGRSTDGKSLWLNSTWRQKLSPIVGNSPMLNRR